MANPTPFSALDGFMNKQVIACVRAKVVKVDNIARGTSQYGDWAMQFASIRDTAGTAYNLTITDPTYFLSQAAVGKVFTAESTPQSKGGPAGVCMSIRDNKGQEQRSIKIDNRAKIVWDGGEAPYIEDSSAPSNQNATQGGGVSAQSGPPQALSDVAQRARDWRKVYDVVDKVVPADFDLELRKDVATTLYLSYKEGYVWRDPVFDSPKAKEHYADDFKQEGHEPEEDLPW